MNRALARQLVLLAAVTLSPNLAAGQTVVHSFADLQPLLKTGQTVVVTGTDGGTTRGTVISLDDKQLEIRSFRSFRRGQPRSFAEQSVRLVERDDSDWDGLLIGAGVGALAILGSLQLPACNRPDDVSCLWIVDAAVPIGMAVGGMIDRARRRPLYMSAPRGGAPVSPLAGSGRLGVVARISF